MTFVTEIVAYHPFTGELCKWMGPYIEAPGHDDAQRFCEQNGLGYCKVSGQLIQEIGQNEQGFADWSDVENFD